MPAITLPDGNKISFSKKIDGFEITNKISKSLSKEACVMTVDGELKDLNFSINILEVVAHKVFLHLFSIVFPQKIPPTHFQNDPQIVSRTHTHTKMTPENSLNNSLNRLFIE